jgi:hypothetical protein
MPLRTRFVCEMRVAETVGSSSPQLRAGNGGSLYVDRADIGGGSLTVERGVAHYGAADIAGVIQLLGTSVELRIGDAQKVLAGCAPHQLFPAMELLHCKSIRWPYWRPEQACPAL